MLYINFPSFFQFFSSTQLRLEVCSIKTMNIAIRKKKNIRPDFPILFFTFDFRSVSVLLENSHRWEELVKVEGQGVKFFTSCV